jgi:putative DNA primase/helicase
MFNDDYNGPKENAGPAPHETGIPHTTTTQSQFYISEQSLTSGVDEKALREAALAHAEHLQLAWGAGNKAFETAPALKDVRPLFTRHIAPKDQPKDRADALFQGYVGPGTTLPFKRKGWRPQMMSVMFSDIDGGNLAIDRVIDLTASFFGPSTIAAAYSSSSATPDNKRWRIAVPLEKPTATTLWRQAMRAFGAFLESHGVPFDRSLLTVNQPVYAPNVPHQILNKDGTIKAQGRWPEGSMGLDGDISGRPIFYAHEYWGHRLVDLSAIGTEIGDTAMREQAERDEAEAKVALQRKAEAEKKYAEREQRRAELLAQGVDGRTPIEIFNAMHDTSDLLTKYGFVEDESKPGHWWHPELQTTASYATEVMPDGKWRTVSGSLREARLGTPSASGFTNHGDAFDLYVHFEHRNDRKAAIKAVAREHNLPAVVKATSVDLTPFNVGLEPMPEALRPFSGAGEGVAALTPDKALQLALTQGANQDTVALGFEALHAGQFLFDGGQWLKWGGHRWGPGATAQARDAMRLLCRGVEVETKRTSAKAFQDGAIFHASNAKTFRRTTADFDADHWLLNTPGQTFNLRTGESWPNRPEDLISKMTRFSPSASGGERFKRFIDEITLGDKELGRYLQVMLGACLSGAVEEHWLGFWYGNGRNGKNSLIDAVVAVLGGYAMFAPSEVLMAKRQDKHSTELADFCGMRLIVSSEVEDGAHWNESRINTLTGDAKLRARKMHTDSFEFPRTWKHIVLGNHRPQLRSSTQAVMSRFKIVPFKASFANVGDQPQSKRLPELLLAEGPYILHWLLEGHAMWLEKMSLPQCKTVEDATTNYFKEQANSKRWIEERCEFGPELKVALQYAYRDYCAWHSSMGTRPESLQRFGETLENDNRVEKQKTKHGQMLFGVGLKDSLPPGVFSGVTS